MSARATLRRIHVWLGWIVGVPLLFWTASGLWMVARPIEEVRGTALRMAPRAIGLPAEPKAPVTARSIRSLAVEMQGDVPRWIVGFVDGTQARADVATGEMVPPVDAQEARRLARSAYRPVAAIVSANLTSKESPPLELRRSRPAWKVVLADGAHVYVDADTGVVLAIRSAQWRWYDWMWGLHIMDLQTRESTSHAVLIATAALALFTTILALVLLPLANRRKRSG